MDDLVVVSCNCCEIELLAKKSVLTRIRMPATWCPRCLSSIPFLVLRKIFIMNLMWADIHSIKQRLSALEGNPV